MPRNVGCAGSISGTNSGEGAPIDCAHVLTIPPEIEPNPRAPFGALRLRLFGAPEFEHCAHGNNAYAGALTTGLENV